ncbi:MAG TPA: DUF423 domain-containing protein [Longimicrobiaceae bacterium]|jgi:uncharacterized membrane protein YgdD (TMEM256/DUF423 family)|nr:DUF423 domain-containing protein [Longimicrobiaceae bacterium]
MRRFWVLGCVFALLAVAAGAFGAHALRGRLAPELLSAFETGARYQMYHALALLAVALAGARGETGGLRLAGWLFVAGTVLFSGSLYALALSGIGVLGAITPLGGLAFMAGWAVLAREGWRKMSAG